MALLKGKISEIPADAVRLNRQEALEYQLKLLSNWKNSSDTFAYKYGTALLAGASSLAGIYISSYYRRKLRLHALGRGSSYLAIMVLPAAMSALLHTEFVIPNVILQDTCATCTEIRASAIQAGIGCLFPSVLAPISGFALATQYGTYSMPYITQQPMKVLNLWRTLTMPFGNVLFAIFIGQALLGSTVTYLESRSILRINEKLAKLEYEMQQAASN